MKWPSTNTCFYIWVNSYRTSRYVIGACAGFVKGEVRAVFMLPIFWVIKKKNLLFIAHVNLYRHIR